jgi:hypothetical protein
MLSVTTPLPRGEFQKTGQNWRGDEFLTFGGAFFGDAELLSWRHASLAKCAVGDKSTAPFFP